MFSQEGQMNEEARAANIQRLNELLRGMKVAMLTTLRSSDSSLHSRPMMVQEQPFDGTLNFLTNINVSQTDEIGAGSQVNLSFADPGQERYISISGAAYLIRDHISIESVWSEIYRPWFPQGTEDPQLALIRVEALEAEVWDSASQARGETIHFT
jgi:general stress protein 26